MKYVLITPARNEEVLIGKTLESVSSQTKPPFRWVIVDDGSTDGTAEIVRGYANRFPWIQLVQRPQRMERSFAGKVHAFNAGLEQVQSLEFDLLANLDSDLSFEPDYLEFLVRQFEKDPRLGVAGTPFIENGYDSAKDSFEGETHVPGGCQMFRRKCFEDIGGYIIHRAGGVDWTACATARLKGWKTRSFREKRFHHYRPLGTAERGAHAALFSYGEKDYYLGNSPIWQIFRIAYRAIKKPVITGSLALLAGYLWAAVRRIPRPVGPELIRFHRKEQMVKLASILRSVFRLNKVDNFNLAPEGKPE
jgi:glycosyltransferase involved in cell wall biosynthesis